MFLGLLDPNSLVRVVDPDHPSIIKQKKIRETLILTALWLLLDFLSLKNDVNVRSKSKKQKKNIFPLHPFLKINEERSRIRS
jgi:hypothetical protein